MDSWREDQARFYRCGGGKGEHRSSPVTILLIINNNNNIIITVIEGGTKAEHRPFIVIGLLCILANGLIACVASIFNSHWCL